LSADNLAGGLAASDRFSLEVRRQRTRLLGDGLPTRAAIFRSALEKLS
jgi:elongation factor P hydroxylase